MLFGHRPVGRRPAAAALGAVDDVVMDQRAGLEQLQRSTHRQHRFRVRGAAGGPPPTPEELRAQPLPAACHEVDQQVDDPGQPGIDGDHLGAPTPEFGVDHGLQPVQFHLHSLPPDRLGDMPTVRARLAAPGPHFSVEFMPPRTDADEDVLWRAVRRLEPLRPAFVSVTYGAGGSRRQRTIRVTQRIAEETTLVPVAHLTAVGHSVAELRQVIGSYAAVGVSNILALRGDPPGDPNGEWVPHPQGLQYTGQLVALARSLGTFCVGVAAYPDRHPRSPDLD